MASRAHRFGAENSGRTYDVSAGWDGVAMGDARDEVGE